LKVVSLLVILCCLAAGADEDFLHWDLKHAQAIAAAARVHGKVGSSSDARGLHTERSINYKLRATWLTPQTIRACSRIEQLLKGLPDLDALRMVEAAEGAGDTVVLVEIDPREGSGIIPSSWTAQLGPAGNAGRKVRGESVPSLFKLPGLSGGARRDYDYDVFWMVFRLKTESGENLFAPEDRLAQLVVQINGKIGKVEWQIPKLR
jgi:hypothetical protein